LDITLNTKRYESPEKGGIELSEGVVWKVWPRYTKFLGQDLIHLEDLITIALLDEPKKYLPVVVRMTTEEAEQFAEKLLSVISKKKLEEEKKGQSDSGDPAPSEDTGS
jgi:hypothetical protein